MPTNPIVRVGNHVGDGPVLVDRNLPRVLSTRRAPISTLKCDQRFVCSVIRLRYGSESKDRFRVWRSLVNGRIRTMNEHGTDVLVLGAGVVGLNCAFRLSAAGREVRILEARKTGSGSSHANCGTLTPSHAPPLQRPGMLGEVIASVLRRDAPLHVPPRLDPTLWRWMLAARRHCTPTRFRHALYARAAMLVHSRALIEDQVRELRLDCGFAENGGLQVYRDKQALENSHWLPDALADVGLPVELLDADQIMAREPSLRDGAVGGYFHALDAQLRPDRYVAELSRIVREQGVVISEDTEVSAIERDGSKITKVHTTRGTWRAREIVLALGAWSPTFARQTGLRIPIQPGKGYSITYSRPTICPRQPLVLKEASVCVTAWRDGYRLGSTMEFSGYDRRLNRLRLDAIRSSASRYLIEPEGPQRLEEWYGWRPMTPDDMPLIGRAPGLDNLTIATGHGMLGVSMAATTGMLVAEMLQGRPCCIDPTPFDPARFMRA